MPVLGDICQMGKIAECAGDLHGFLGLEPAKKPVELPAGFVVGFMFEGRAQAADGLDRFEGLDAFLFADRFAEKRRQKANVIEQQPLHFWEVANAGVERINHRASAGQRRHNRPDKRKLKSGSSRKCLLPRCPGSNLPRDRLHFLEFYGQIATPAH